MNSISRTKEILTETEKFIRLHFESEGSGHDWWHIHRVRNLAVHIAEIENADLFIVELAALLHDLDDWKISGDKNLTQTRSWLKRFELSHEQIERVLVIIEEVSFKGAKVPTPTTTLEAAIVQDADRLDAIGAIGIARTFAYGGNKKRLLYHPDEKPQLHASFEEYQNTTASTISHFYEKLLLLKKRMNTKTAKEMAEKRHQFMETYLENFYAEWDGKI